MITENNSFSSQLANYNQLYETLVKLFFDYDPMGISHVPDEYSPEARTVLNRLAQAKSSPEIASILEQEFDFWFGDSNTNTAQDFLPLAEEIWKHSLQFSFEKLFPANPSTEFYVNLINQLEIQFADFKQQWILFESLVGIENETRVLLDLARNQALAEKNRFWVINALKYISIAPQQANWEEIVANIFDLLKDIRQPETLRVLIAKCLQNHVSTAKAEKKLTQILVDEPSRKVRLALLNLFSPEAAPNAEAILWQLFEREIETDLRIAILVTLARYPNPQVLDPLVEEYVGDTSSDNKLLLISGLANFPQDLVIDFLIGSLNEQDEAEKVRLEIIEVLAKIAPEPKFFEQLTKLALTDPLAKIRASAVYKLGRSDMAESIAIFVQATCDSSLAVQEAALSALSNHKIRLYGKATQAVLRLISHENENMRFRVSAALANCHPQVALELLKSENVYARDCAVMALVSLKTLEAIEPLLELAKRVEGKQFSAVCIALSSTIQKHEESSYYQIVFDWLLKLLDDENPFVRATAANILGRLRFNSVIVDRLSRQLEKETDPEVITSLTQALGFSPDEYSS